MAYPITELFAWVVDDPAGQHGIVAFRMKDGTTAQAVTSNPHVAMLLSEEGKLAAKVTGLPVRLQRFVLAETVKEY